MEYKGTTDFTLFIDNTALLQEGKYVRGYRALICYRESGLEVFTLTSNSYELVVVHSNRICNDLQLEREQRIEAAKGKQLGLGI